VSAHDELVAQGASKPEADRLADERYPRPRALDSGRVDGMIENFNQSIESLRAEVRRIEASHPADKARLERLVAELERASHPETNREGLTSQVREAVVHFEAEHPQVTAILNRVLGSLDSVGI